MVSFPKAKPKRRKNRASIEAKPGRVVLLYGPPGSGTSTVAEVLKEASETPIMIIRWSGVVEEGIEAIHDAIMNGYEVILVDFDGGFIMADDIQAIVDAGLIWNAKGCAIRLYADQEECKHRAQYAKRATVPDERDFREWHKDALEVERRVYEHNLPYFTISNLDLAETVKLVALRCGLSR